MTELLIEPFEQIGKMVTVPKLLEELPEKWLKK